MAINKNFFHNKREIFLNIGLTIRIRTNMSGNKKKPEVRQGRSSGSLQGYMPSSPPF